MGMAATCVGCVTLLIEFVLSVTTTTRTSPFKVTAATTTQDGSAIQQGERHHRPHEESVATTAAPTSELMIVHSKQPNQWTILWPARTCRQTDYIALPIVYAVAPGSSQAGADSLPSVQFSSVKQPRSR